MSRVLVDVLCQQGSKTFSQDYRTVWRLATEELSLFMKTR